jgi:hypothetical protein
VRGRRHDGEGRRLRTVIMNFDTTAASCGNAVDRLSSTTFLPQNDLELPGAPARFPSVMNRSQLLDMVKRTRLAADECERLRITQAERIRKLRVAGVNTAEFENALSQLEAECDRHMAEMERLLDELDKVAAS